MKTVEIRQSSIRYEMKQNFYSKGQIKEYNGDIYFEDGKIFSHN